MVKLKIAVIGQDMTSPSGSGGKDLKKQGYWSSDPWTPGTLPRGVLRTKVRYDSPSPYGQSSQTELPKKKTSRNY